jgi:uncharacterized repeat protein (TIGR01451 family)
MYSIFQGKYLRKKSIIQTSLIPKDGTMRTFKVLIPITIGLIAALALIAGFTYAGNHTSALAATNGTITVCPGGVGCDHATIAGAIAAANPAGGDIIEVRAGTYTEAGITIDRNLTIQGEGAQTTILQAADAPGIAINRVISIPVGITVSIDGLTIRYGRLTFSSPNSSGAGISNQGYLTLTHSIVFSNTTTGQGGGLFNGTNSSAILNDNSFIENNANNGGAIYNNGNQLVISIGTLSRNSADSYGGGIASWDSDLILTNVDFNENTINSTGGGMYNDDSSVSLTNVAFNGNQGGEGSGISNRSCDPILTNVIFSGNTASSGSAVYNDGASPKITNVTIVSNTNGIRNVGESKPILKNVILWGNGTYQISNNGTSAIPEIYNSDIQDSGGSGGSWDGNLGDDKDGNIDADPDFVRDPNSGDGDWSTRDDNDYGDLHLIPGSPAIDKGTNTGCPSHDYDGDNRPINSVCDIGVYETGYTIEMTKLADDASPEPGQIVNFTIVITNSELDVTGGSLSDNLPVGLNYLGPISLEPSGAGTVGSYPPALASNLIISYTKKVTVTFPVTIDFGLASGTQIVNISSFTSNEVIAPVLASVTLTVANLPPNAKDDGGIGFETSKDAVFTTASVLPNDTDPNGDTLSIVGFYTTGTLGLVTDNGDGTFDYDPDGQFDALAEDQQATDTFTYSISDGHGGTDTATVTITIKGKPDNLFIYLPLVMR